MTRYLLLTSLAGSWALLVLSGVVSERGTFAWETSDSARGAALVAILESRPPGAEPSSAEIESRPPDQAVATVSTSASSNTTPADAEVPPPATPQPARKPTEPSPVATVPAEPKNAIDDAANRPDKKHQPADSGVATR